MYYHSIILGWFGPTELIIIVLVVLLLFGGKKIPELMRGIGKGVKEFKDGMDGKENKKSEPPVKEEVKEIEKN